jgi:hypothetical protein
VREEPALNYVELFAGAGGGILAHSVLHGHRLVAAAQYEPEHDYAKKGPDYASLVLAHQQAQGRLPPFPNLGDVSTIDGRQFLGIDLLTGGFPCKGISPAGRKLMLDDPRSKLIFEMLRIAGQSQPRYIFAENSDRLRSVLHLIVPELQALGYHQVAWCVVRASDLGAYHERPRMWLLAKRGGPPFIHQWGDHRKNPACGVLMGNRLTRITPAFLGVRAVPERNRLPTLICSDARNSGNRPGEGCWSLSDRLGLTNKAGRLKRLPTLTASDYRGAWEGEGLERQLAKRSKPLRDMLPYIVRGPGKAISPVWGEWFMGWPMGWTDITVSLSAANLSAWKKAVKDDQYWSPEVERLALPATLVKRSDMPFQPQRITALGNGQVPVVAAAAFDALREILG